MKTSLFNAVLDTLPKNMALEFGIDIVGIHMDEPQLWAKALKFLEFGTEQHLVCLLAILRQTNYTLRHSENEVHEFYKCLNERCLNEKNNYGLSEERIAEYRKFLHENWTDWSKLKKWLLESTPVQR